MWQWDLIGSLSPSKDGLPDFEVAAEPPPVKVISQPVTLTTNDRIFKVVGTGRARQSVDIHPAVAENVISVEFEPGDLVETGQVLYRLDDSEARYAIGYVLFAGLILSSLITLYLTPISYRIIAPWTKPRSTAGDKLKEEMEKASRSTIPTESSTAPA